MSSETLDEARKRAHRLCCKSDGSGVIPDYMVPYAAVTHAAIEYLVTVERADAERVQRERADGLEAAIQGAIPAMLAADKALSSSEALAIDTIAMLEMIGDLEKKAIEQATRPYRMAIARWWVDGGHNWSSRSGERLRSMLTDADIAAAREEAGRE